LKLCTIGDLQEKTLLESTTFIVRLNLVKTVSKMRSIEYDTNRF